jgi:hypothetical protein
MSINEQTALIERSTLETIQGNPAVVPVGLTLGALGGAAIGSFIGRNQELRPGLFSGWAGYLTVIGAAFGWALTAGLVARPRKH